MKNILNKLVAGGENFCREEVKNIMLDITRNKFSNEQIAAFLMGIQMKGITAEELLGLRDAMLETGIAVDLSSYNVLDIVGTGGDGKNTFNISTCACFVVAGAGYKVAKHGNYAATSVSGASSVLENHGVRFTNDNKKLLHNIEECNFTYLHAPLFAQAMRFVAPVRKALEIPTCFNLLGPAINPCRPQYQMLGVANLGQMRLYNNMLHKLDVQYCIVNSTDGYDEISLTGPFKIMSHKQEKVFHPSDINMETCKAEDIFGGANAEEAKKIFDNVLNGTATSSQKNVVVVNAAFAINIIESEKSIEECISMVQESLESGKALASFRKFIALNS